VIADLDTLLTALYVELTDRIIPVRGLTRRGPGGQPVAGDRTPICRPHRALVSTITESPRVGRSQSQIAAQLQAVTNISVQ